MATLEIISGNGQIVSPGFPTEPLVVRLTNGGLPVSGATVTWTLSGRGSISRSTTTTGADGYTETLFFGDPMITIMTSWETSTITAAASGAGSVTFYATTTTRSASGFAVFPTPTLLAPSTSTGWAGNPSATLSGGLRLQVKAISGTDAGHNVPYLGVWITGGEEGSTPTARLPGGVVLTGSDGLTSDVILGPVAGGPVSMVVNIGGFAQYTVPLLIAADATSVTAGPGNYQNTFIGWPFDSPITVVVVGSTGNPSVGTPVVWTVVTPGSLTITSSDSVTDSRGWALASVTAGAAAGEYTITAEALGKTATFHLTIDDPLSVLRVSTYAGYGQTAKVGEEFAAPLVAIVTDLAAQPVSGVTVTFAVGYGSVTLGSSSDVTNDSGQAQTTVTAGPYAGAARVNASITGSSCVFSLTVVQDYVPPPGGGEEGGGVFVGSVSQASSLGFRGLLGVTLVPAPSGGGITPEPEPPDYTHYPVCLESYDKHPYDVLDLGIDWSEWLADDVILTSTWDDGGLSSTSSAKTDTTTTLYGVSGGTDGETYWVTNTITTAKGLTEVRRLRVRVWQLHSGDPVEVGWLRGIM